MKSLMRNVVMKYIKKVLFLIIFASSLHSYAQILDLAFIGKKAVEIEKKMTRDCYIKYAFTAVAIAHEIYQWIPMIKDFMSPQSSSFEEASQLSFVQAFKAGIKHLFYTKEGLTSLIQSGFSIGGFVIISQFAEKFMHPDTVRWYVQAYAPYYATIKTIKEKISDLQDPLLDDEHRGIDNKIIVLLYDRLVRQAHCMCAYITYKIKYLEPAEKIIGEHSRQSIIKIHNKWLADIQQQLDTTKTLDFSVITILLDGYHDAISAQLRHFALTEGETKKERIAVKKQMQ